MLGNQKKLLEFSECQSAAWDPTETKGSSLAGKGDVSSWGKVVTAGSISSAFELPLPLLSRVLAWAFYLMHRPRLETLSKGSSMLWVGNVLTHLLS